MEAVELIATALVTGAALGVQQTAGTAVKDAYAGLKTLIRKCFEDKPASQLVLVESEKKPDTWKAPLTEALREAGADKDAAIVEAARRVLTIAFPEEAQAGKYNVTIGTVQGAVIGDNAQVQQNFSGTTSIQGSE